MSPERIKELAAMARSWDLGEHAPRATAEDAIRAAIAETREECAREADYYAKNSGVARNIAAAIRARKD